VTDQTEQTNGEPRAPTERVVLKQERVIVLPFDVAPEQLAAAVEAAYPKASRAVREAAVADGWLEVSRQTAASKVAAIEAYAGKPGTADAKLGIFRAPTVTSWKDAVVHSAPPLPLIERQVIE
jgi:hypothetical protein